jgi:hypothetical protein
MIRKNRRSRFSEAIMRKKVQQQSGRWAGQGARTTERMDAIRNIKTMAGSPDADLIDAISISQSCAWPLYFRGPLFREPMKDE